MQRYARANDTQLTRLVTSAVLGLAGLRSPESSTVVLECLPQEMRRADFFVWVLLSPRQKLFLQAPGIHVLKNAFTNF
jgi:hypothetical protein